MVLGCLPTSDLWSHANPFKLVKINACLIIFFISQSQGFLDPVFQLLQIKFGAKNNPLYTVYQHFIFSAFLNCVLTPIRGPQSPLNLLNKTQCLPLTLTQAFYSSSQAVIASLTSSPLYSSFRMLGSWLDFLFTFFHLFHDSRCCISHIRQWVKGSLPLMSAFLLLWDASLLGV